MTNLQRAAATALGACADNPHPVQEILQDGNRYIVRSIASGTPKGKFFGKEAKAGFKIMTIDTHEVNDGKITRSYHVEDWARAIRQVSGNSH